MPNAFFNIAPLIASITAGHLILTPNYRLARHITQAWGQHCAAQGLQTWRQPLVMALDAWLASCWEELIESADLALLAPPRAVIDKHGEQLLWQASIRQDDLLPVTADTASLAELAMQTWQQLQRCRVPLNELADSHHPGTASLLRWLETFKQGLEQRQLLTWEQAQGLIAQAYKDGDFPGYKAIRLVGFQTLAALQQDIIDAATSDIAHYQVPAQPAHITIHRAHDQKSEISAAAQWAKVQHEANPEQRIGIVFGNLAKSQQQVSRIFHDTFVASHCLPSNERGIAPFNFSAGSPLGRSPLLESAFSLLAVQNHALPLERWCQLLGDPFWGASKAQAEATDTEQLQTRVANHHLIARAHCELLLRDSNQLMHSPAAFRAYLAEAERQSQNTAPDSEKPAPEPPSAEAYPSLATAWQAIAERVRRQPQSASFCYWAQEFAQRLELLGWPGPRALDSIEYQQYQNYVSLLEDFASLDTSAPPLAASAALTQLTRMAQATIFQAQSHDSPVQVLGLLEAAGLAFDQLWIAGMDDRQWPQPTSLSPLLPVDVQQRYQLPRSSAQQELDLARQLLEGFQHNSPQLIFSYAAQDGDTELEASRLLPEPSLVPPTSTVPLAPCPHPLYAALPPVALQKIDATKGPALQTDGQSIRGGTAILQAQAGSPFNAFAIWRLGAQALAQPSSGLSAIERGNLVHRCLELFWTRFHDQAAVKALDSSALEQAIGEVIAEAMRPLQQSRSDILGPRFAAIEARRLQQLLQQWLDIELQRQSFRVIAPEKQLTMSIGGLPLKLRIDRIDRLEDNRVVLIDYKTGATNIHCWAGERLEEPQLPLYALALPEQVGALCFGQISTAKSVVAKGVSDTPELIPGLQPLAKINFDDWQSCLEVWREQLETLAEEFLDGQAEVAFYTSAALRYQSHLYPLNRWPEIAQRGNAADDLDAELDV
ncbi:hypothetical protein A9Q89_11215 [Gammaproteobacteria bacterium 53_120_T64]|nr:hypothetical protein A9Q89_11215 [Gammaproteobacteria bacterium 53_120_T64]